LWRDRNPILGRFVIRNSSQWAGQQAVWSTTDGSVVPHNVTAQLYHTMHPSHGRGMTAAHISKMRTWYTMPLPFCS
jgi:hypothetical protein